MFDAEASAKPPNLCKLCEVDADTPSDPATPLITAADVLMLLCGGDEINPLFVLFFSEPSGMLPDFNAGKAL